MSMPQSELQDARTPRSNRVRARVLQLAFWRRATPLYLVPTPEPQGTRHAHATAADTAAPSRRTAAPAERTDAPARPDAARSRADAAGGGFPAATGGQAGRGETPGGAQASRLARARAPADGAAGPG